jgi:hypothetical protein
MNIRSIGSYEIVILNENHKRIKEVVTDLPLFEIESMARRLIDEKEINRKAF